MRLHQSCPSVRSVKAQLSLTVTTSRGVLLRLSRTCLHTKKSPKMFSQEQNLEAAEINVPAGLKVGLGRGALSRIISITVIMICPFRRIIIGW